LEALRSGRYKQGKLKLRFEDNFCCLGVLCDVLQPDKWSLDNGCYVHPDRHPAPSSEILRSDLLDSENVQMELSRMNDEGATFAEIADRIEELVCTAT
jgi:hypothetical protein